MNLPCGCGSANDRPCDCCTGVGLARPDSPWNPSGLAALNYRIGTHATFVDAMIGRLSSAASPALAALRTRERADPAIALLDAWATVADVLTFYQERIANEGYLRTATERRSVLELARLIGYEARPGVSATTYLAYTLEKDSAPVSIEPGSQAASVPGPGEQMQTYETADPLDARVEWNRLVPRRTEPQTVASITAAGLYLKGAGLNLKPNDPLLVDIADGAGPQLFRIQAVEIDAENVRTRVVIRPWAGDQPIAALRRIVRRFSHIDAFDVSPDAAMTKRVLAILRAAAAEADRSPARLKAHLKNATVPALEAELDVARERRFTKLEPWIDAMLGEVGRVAAMAQTPQDTTAQDAVRTERVVLGEAVGKLKQPPSLPPPGPRQLIRGFAQAFGSKADTLPRVLASLQPALKKTLYGVYRSLPPQATRITVHAMRVSAAPFGHNAPPRLTDVSNGVPHFGEWQIDEPLNAGTINGTEHSGAQRVDGPAHHTEHALFLDAEYAIAPDSLIVVEKPDGESIVVPQAEVVARSLPAYGLSGKSTLLILPESQPWLADGDTFAAVRNTRVFAGSEPLVLAEVPITASIGGQEIELDQVYEDLEPGRWLILIGERDDLTGSDGQPVRGLKTGELLMLAAVAQRRRVAEGKEGVEDANHTFITLAQPLAFTYAPGTVAIYGNVVRATHGETVHEVLGSGDASATFQRFTLKRPPVTYVSAPTVSGVSNTLAVRVNEVLWHEARSFGLLSAADRAFIVRTGDDATTAVVFGNGERGARVPTGVENITAAYRTGLGKAGNVGAGQISLLTTRPLGVKEVVNPLRASGGADRDDRDEARANAPLAVAALDRLVSTRDYADFTRTFAGIGKAAAARLSDGRRQTVHVTVAGAADIPIEPTSDLFRNLTTALHRFGDPHIPIRLDLRERLALVIGANVRVAPDYAWDSVEPRIRAALLRVFGFAQVRLGRDLVLANAIAAVQRIPGVAYVDVDVFDTVSEAQVLADFSEATASALARRERVAVRDARVEGGTLRPAQLAYLTPDVPDTLILQEITS